MTCACARIRTHGADAVDDQAGTHRLFVTTERARAQSDERTD